MKNLVKVNLTIILSFELPFIFIVGLALMVYVPSRSITTQYNFLYATCEDGTNYYNAYCNEDRGRWVSVQNSKLFIEPVYPTIDTNNDGVPDEKSDYKIRFFLHDTAKNESREIALAEANALTLNDLLTSSDGVTFTSGYDRNADILFLFDGGSSYGYYLTKGNGRQKINVINGDAQYYYNNNIKFVGWVLPGRN